MLNEAIKNYDFKHPEAILIRHNENMTYLIKDNNQSFLLRIHKTVDGLDLSAGSRNIHRSILIDSEIKLLNQLRMVGKLKTQYPIKTLEKNFQTEMEEETRKIKEKFICKRCEYLREGFTSLGHYCVCRKKSRGYYDYTKIKKCKDFKEKKD
jgi:hypothetical protein